MICTPHQMLLGKGDEMCRAHGLYQEEKKCIQVSDRETYRKVTSFKTQVLWENKFKTELKK